MSIVIQNFAYHFVDKKNYILQPSKTEENVANLNATIKEFFENLTSELWDAEDSGNTVSGQFSDGVNPSPARPLIQAILADPGTILANSTKLADLLFQVSPGNASPGVLAVLVCGETETQMRYIAIYKIKCEDRQLIRLLSGGNLPELSVEDIKNLLLKELQKGAIIPHPNRPHYDLKLTDLQSPIDPTKYFGSAFLGCVAKKSDEHQIKKLVPELINYGVTQGVHINTECIPAVLDSLSKVEGSVTIPVLEEIVKQENLYQEGYSPETFTAFAENSPDIKQLDIPPEKLVRKKSGVSRKIFYTFRDPELAGIVISGPAAAMQKIRSTQGDTIILHLEAIEANIDIRYE